MIRRLCVFSFVLLAATGCSSLFLYPDRRDYFPDAKKFIVYDEGFIPASGGEKLHYWMIPPQKNKVPLKESKGIIIQVHGNAQNLSSHVRGLGWITEAGYTLAIFDYRGYGKSSGKASLGDAYSDVQTALDFITTNLNPNKLPVFFYGQSLGGTLLMKAVSSSPGRWQPKLIVIESSFPRYSSIAREKLSLNWFTWPFQWLAYPLITDRYSLKEEELQSIAPIPVYMFYSERDPIVPVHHGRKIFEQLKEPKFFFSYPEPGHINSMWVQDGKFRKVLVDALEKARQ